jgi:anhydro-N-acetylmuramic acid kinase
VPAREALYIGLMSGTSLDGVDAVLAQCDYKSAQTRVLAHVHQDFAPSLREELLALNSPGPNELHRAALAGNTLAISYTDAVSALLQLSGIPAAQIAALGAHGQTVRHRPGEFDATGYTLQLLNGALLAELSGIDTICDFRSRDVAAHGQGAPLVPAFHRAAFGRPGADIAVVNIGGISNISILAANGSSSGFDCGPGNCLLDFWVHQHKGLAYDADGEWAASGQIQTALLQSFLSEPFLSLPPPRSTGRDLFNKPWLEQRLQNSNLRAEDVQATLLEFSAIAIVQSIQAYAPTTSDLLVCGGGALNGQLMRRLQALLPARAVMSTEARGLPVMQVEAAAFAWLAMRFSHRLPGNLSSATGAAGPRLLGALYPA